MSLASTRPFASRRVLLGVTGGIASYKSAWLARLLTKAGAAVDVVMTRAATEFVGPVTFEALTGRPVHTGLFDAGRALEHVTLARAADAIVVAPATADFLARAASGQADDLLTACLLAATCPVLLVPAMNDRMWAHPQTQRNVHHLGTLGYRVLPPDEGMLAAGEGSGPGRMPEPETIFAHAGRLLETPGPLAGLRVAVTAGPTREALDPVRFLSNHSSGKMGAAIAAAAWRRGADVDLIAGPLAVAPPVGPRVTAVETTADMADAVRRALATADLLVMAAAPADFTPAAVAPSKIKKGSRPPTVALDFTVDILASTRDARRPGAVIVGFALETDDVMAHARAKLEAKELDLIVVNDATEEGAGFAVDTNRVTLLDRAGGSEALPLMPKSEVADAILDRVEGLLGGR
ncbi:MAG: bifunctional phosphopantothenoylcysteine decarboxylase/phosphopantothenate--cysteine ligase CoaBC [Gemmatimonadota bacterium]|nr:bifunctional phosphopantothenoylcysteine decarboxylase/phosphopantothenate--cysteine ligase CoaBC [Gemmatimonadota bacterium]MDE3172503.1 bifunctional phosphopantothenoylcysteine decarboxylase/phosphopantothenate--cysteine ligase CoaBC [Gemmatimonadota bacterium]MDE3216570.1 bifunctional phosphopantothenoylcysteine decarboxylase/phosphopantothenate--cysteine ligase CoaBC [Gemmatimonadota bacterium]